MNILIVNMSIDPILGGGTVERTLQLSAAFERLKNNVNVLTTNTGVSSAYVNQLNKRNLKITAFPSVWKRFYLSVFSRKQIEALVRKADVVLIMNHWTVINILVFWAVKKFNTPYAVCPAGALPVFGRSRFLKKSYNHVAGKSMIRDAKGLIAISENEMNHYKAYGADPGKVSIIPNGIKPDEFPYSDGKKFRKSNNIENGPIILFVGRLNPIKGPDLLLEAFRRCVHKEKLKSSHLVFAGPDGGMLSSLKKKVRNTGIGDRVHFTGYIGGFEKADAYRAADFLVIPSRQEAMSIVVLEAGISGIPVLLTDQCGFDDVDRVGGGMVVEATVKGLENGLLSMSSNLDKLPVMGRNLNMFVSKYFLWDHIAKQHLNLFSGMI